MLFWRQKKKEKLREERDSEYMDTSGYRKYFAMAMGTVSVQIVIKVCLTFKTAM